MYLSQLNGTISILTEITAQIGILGPVRCLDIASLRAEEKISDALGLEAGE